MNVIEELPGQRISYWCEGCGKMHEISIDPKARTRFNFDGNKAKPNFTPAATFDEPHCTHVLKDGRIRYGLDCAHYLAGRTVNMKPLPN